MTDTQRQATERIKHVVTLATRLIAVSSPQANPLDYRPFIVRHLAHYHSDDVKYLDPAFLTRLTNDTILECH